MKNLELNVCVVFFKSILREPIDDYLREFMTAFSVSLLLRWLVSTIKVMIRLLWQQMQVG